MWSKVAKLASPAPRKPSSSLSKQPADESSFLRLVDQLRSALSYPTPPASRTAGESKDSVSHLLRELLRLLQLEQQAGVGTTPLGACTELLLRDAVLDELVDLACKDGEKGNREELVRWYGRAIVELDEAWLSHSAVNKPLVKLLRSCVDEDGGLKRQEELAVVEVMCVVAERIKTRPELLAIFFREKAGSRRQKDLSSSIAAAINRSVPLTTLSSFDADGGPSSPTFSHASTSEASTSFTHSQTSSAVSPRRRADHDFLLFSYLLRFIHREGDVGDYAREGILSLVDVAFGYPNLYTPSFALQPTSSSSTVSPSTVLAPPTPTSAAREAVLAFAEFLLDSDFAEVLGAGLGALYGLLPRKLAVRTGAAAGEGAAAGGAGQDGELVSGGMVLGGMGALHAEEDAEALERKREEEEMRLRAEGYGISGTEEFREGLDGFLKLVEFTQDILRRSTDGILLERDGAGEGGEDESEETEDIRQQKLVMNALTAAVLGAVRKLFLENVLYPSILECSETDGSAVAVLSYLDAMLEVVQEGTKLEKGILGFLLAEDDGPFGTQQRPRQRPSNVSTSSSPSANFLSPQPASSSKVKRRKSSALLLIERAAAPHDHSDYFTSLGRFSLRDLLLSHVHSTSQPTAAAALKLLSTMLAYHDRWSLALLDVALDEGATSFPVALRDTPPVDLDDDSNVDEFVYRAPQQDDSSDDEFVYPSSSTSAPTTPRPFSSLAPAKPTLFATTPAPAHQRLLGTPLPSTPSVTLHLDSLDTLLSLVSVIDPSYRRLRSMGGGAGSEMLTTGFANYLRDAEATLANDAGFRRGLANPPVAGKDEEGGEGGPRGDGLPHPQSHRHRSTLFGSTLTLSGRDFAATKSGFRHKLLPSAKLVALLLESLAAFFSHSPDVNLSLTEVLAALATYPYRSLEGWLLPAINGVKGECGEDEDEGWGKKGKQKGGKDDSSRSDDGDDRSVDFEVDERGRHDALLSPLPTPRNASTLFGFNSSTSPDAPPSATRAALPTSDSLLAILDALAKSVEQYRRNIPEFDTYLAERRQGLFFADNLADALQADDLGAGGGVEENAFGLPLPPPSPSPAPPPPQPEPKMSSGLGFGSFFSPRRPSHNRSPSSPVNAYSTPTKPSSSSCANLNLPARPSQLRRSASSDSLAAPSTTARPSSSTLAPPVPSSSATKDGPASPFAAHYRKTGGITVTPIVVSTPGSVRRRAADEDEEEEGEEEEGGQTGGPDSPTKRLSAPSSAARSPSSASSVSALSSTGELSSKEQKPASTVSLSTVLDNVIVLEEFVKELAAIVYVRRAVGIDAVRFV
ncbi:hypothetical protein JCM8547_000839 [Rhodosporidiobolus lusitaniae]